MRTLSEHDPAESANLQFGKRIGDGTAYAIDRMTGAYQARTLYQTIVQIDAALDRLRDGTYGTCQGCGAAIPAERLEAVRGLPSASAAPRARPRAGNGRPGGSRASTRCGAVCRPDLREPIRGSGHVGGGGAPRGP